MTEEPTMARMRAWGRYEIARQRAEGAPALSAEALARSQALREAQQADCVAGIHEDPDNSGLCIRCGAELPPSGAPPGPITSRQFQGAIKPDTRGPRANRPQRRL